MLSVVRFFATLRMTEGERLRMTVIAGLRMTGRALSALEVWWQQVGDAICDGVTIVALAAKERASDYLPLFLFGYFEFERAFAHRTG